MTNAMRDSELTPDGIHRDWERIWVASTTNIAAFCLTPEGFVSTWNPGGTAIYGYAREDIVGRHYAVFFPEDARERTTLESELREARANHSFETEGWRRRKDG